MSQVPETRDSLLLRLADAADHEAWCQFTAIYRPLIYRVARRRGLQDADAQDLAQQVLLSVAGAIDESALGYHSPKFARGRFAEEFTGRRVRLDHPFGPADNHHTTR